MKIVYIVARREYARDKIIFTKRERVYLIMILFIISIAALLIIVELALRLFWPQDLRKTYVNGMKLGRRDPEFGYLCNPGASVIVKSPEFTVEYKINLHGLRDETLHDRARDAGISRILLIGDSFAFGGGVNYDSTWPTILERKLVESGFNIDVIKGGAPFRNTYHSLFYLKKMCEEYSPDLAVLSFLPNNLIRNAVHATGVEYAPQQTLKPWQTMIKRYIQHLHTPILVKRIMMMNNTFYVWLYSITHRSQFNAYPFNSFVSSQLNATKALLLEMNTFCQKRGIKFLVISIPQQFQLLADSCSMKQANIVPDCIDNYFSAVAAENGFHWFSVLPFFCQKYRRDKRNLYYRFDGHLNYDGNDFLGSLSFDVIATEFGIARTKLASVRKSEGL